MSNPTQATARFNPPNIGVPHVLNLRGLRFAAGGEGGDGGTPGAGGDGGGGGAYTPPASQEEFDRIIADRLKREREKTANRYADYDELKAKAAKFDEADAASKTELQRALERAEAAEAKVKDYETTQQVAAWKTEVVDAAKGADDKELPADKKAELAAALRGNTKEELEAHAETLLPLIAAAGSKKAAVGPYVPGEGSSPAEAKTGDVKPGLDRLRAAYAAASDNK